MNVIKSAPSERHTITRMGIGSSISLTNGAATVTILENKKITETAETLRENGKMRSSL